MNNINMSEDKIPEIVIEWTNKATNKDQKQAEKDNKVAQQGNPVWPVDRGWAWMILLGSMLQMTLIVGLQKSSGILFVTFQQRFNSTSSMTSLLSTVQNAAYSLSAPVVMTIGLKISSARSMLFIGSVITTVSYVISAYAERIQILLFSYGVLQGIGMAFMVPPSVSVLGIYFLEKRGLANSVAVSGASVGGFILAPLITYLLRVYGYQGCMLIIGAILLNGCLSGALFRSKSYYQRRCDVISVKHINKEKVLISRSTNGKYSVARNTECHAETNDTTAVCVHSKFRREHIRNKTETETLYKSLPELSDQQIPFRGRTFTNTSQIDRWMKLNKPQLDSNGEIFNSFDLIKCSSLDMAVVPSVPNKIKTIKTTTGRNKEIIRSLLDSFDLKLFKNPIFILLIVIAFLISSSTLLIAIFLAPHAKDMDISAEGIATVVTVFSATDLIARLVIGVLSDKGWLRRSTIVGFGAVVQGIAAQFMWLFSSFNLFIIYTIIIGIFSGAYFALFPVVIVDYLTLDRLNSALGFVALFNGAGISLTFYVMGYIRDVTGSYIVSYHVIGTMGLVGGVLTMLLPLFERCQWKKEQTQRLATKT